MMKKHIPVIAVAAISFATGGVASAQSGVSGALSVGETADRAQSFTRISVGAGTSLNMRHIDMLGVTGAGVMMAPAWLADIQPEPKPAADASQAATAAPGGKAPNSQPPAATPAAPAKLSLIEINIEGIENTKSRPPTVRYSYDDKKTWTVAKIGDKLKEGVAIQLGYFTKIRLRVGDGQYLNFDNAGTFVVNEAYNDGKTDITRISMNQGGVTFDVKKVRFANDVIITTPDMTLAIRGTVGGIKCTPGQPTMARGAENNHGLIVLENLRTRQRTAMTGNERSDSVSFMPAVNLAQASVVETATDSARERDENRVLKRTEGSTQSVPLDVGDINSSGLRIDLMPMLTPHPGPSISNSGNK